MYPQYTQGYPQASVPNPMMPQYQPAVQYQQPMQPMQPMGQPMQPQWNNAPLANQPANVTQTGIPFDQIRQDLANMILQNGNRDALAQALYQDTSFNNFQSGALDKLVTAVALQIQMHHYNSCIVMRLEKCMILLGQHVSKICHRLQMILIMHN